MTSAKTVRNPSKSSTLGKINSVFSEVAGPGECKSRPICGSLNIYVHVL